MAVAGDQPRGSAHMTPEEWRRVRPILESALDLDPTARPGFVDKACTGDEHLRREILSLLDNQKTGKHLLEEPALDMVRERLVRDQILHDKERDAALLGKTISHYRILQKLG